MDDLEQTEEIRLGYRMRFFRGRVTQCGRCRRTISGGWTHPRDTGNPPKNALCRGCYATILGIGPDD